MGRHDYYGHSPRSISQKLGHFWCYLRLNYGYYCHAPSLIDQSVLSASIDLITIREAEAEAEALRE
jgi:hypothetical protein